MRLSGHDSLVVEPAGRNKLLLHLVVEPLVMGAFPDCKDGRVVADVVRLEKGHTEGLEPKVTEELIKLMLSAKGGKMQQAR